MIYRSFIALMTFGFVCATLEASPQHRPAIQRAVQEKWRCTAAKCKTREGFQHCLESQPNYFGPEAVHEGNPNCIRSFLEHVCNQPEACTKFGKEDMIHSGDKSRYWPLPLICVDTAITYFKKHEKHDNEAAIKRAHEMIPQCARDIKSHCDGHNNPNDKNCALMPHEGGVTLKQFGDAD